MFVWRDFLLAVALGLTSWAKADDELTWGRVVDLGYAKYRGKYDWTWHLDVYEGIRYANQPKRWLKAEIPPAVNETLEVQDTGTPPPCIQFGPKRWDVLSNHQDSEDCLFLNVFTPSNRNDTDKLPVLVWIHSGDYQSGRANTDPRLLMKANDNGFLFVEMQYRLGILGFLAFDTYEVRQEDGGWNNIGLEDQRLALEWVRKHIGKFGGDGDRITLGGHGSGGGAVMLHSMSNAGGGDQLFQNAIMASPFLLPVHGHDTTADPDLRDLMQDTWKASPNRHEKFMPKEWSQLLRGKDRMKTRPAAGYHGSTLAGVAMAAVFMELKCGRKSDLANKIGLGGCLRERSLASLREIGELVTDSLGVFRGRALFGPVTEGPDRIGRIPDIGDQWGLIRDFPSRHLMNESASLVPKNLLIGTNYQDGIPLGMEKRHILDGDDPEDFNTWFEDTFVLKYQHSLASMDWEERDLIHVLYRNGTVGEIDSNGNPVDDNGRALAEDSPPLVSRFPIMCDRDKSGPLPQQHMVNRILTEVFYHCPAEWTASAPGTDAEERNTWRYEIRHEQNLHGDDLDMLFPPSDTFNPLDKRFVTRRGIMHALQRMWGRFIMQDSPVIDVDEAAYDNIRSQVPTKTEGDETKLHWPQYPWMMVLDTQGGETKVARPFGLDNEDKYKCPVRFLGPPSGLPGQDKDPMRFRNQFSLANSKVWNDGRAGRCGWWQEHGHKISL